jgi:predicted transcriptional regulator
MKQTFTFRYDPAATPQDLFARFERAMKTGKPDIRRHELSSNSISALLSLMTASRIHLFYAIANSRPESLYALAKGINRDQANVLKEAKLLEGIGLIKLVAEADGGRERLRPISRYYRIVFDFGMAAR